MNFVLVIFGTLCIIFYLQAFEKEAKLKLKKIELKDSIILIERIIEIQKNTPPNTNSDEHLLDVDISNEKAELKEPSARTELALIAVGTLHLHHNEFIFLSTTQTRNIKLSNIIKIDLFTDSMRLYLKNRQKTITFADLDTPTALYHLSTLFNKMNEKYSTSQWEDPEYFILELTKIVNKLNTELLTNLK